MLNFDPNRIDPHTLQVNQAATERHVNDDHYVRGLTPGEFVLDGTNAAFAIIPPAILQWPAIEMPDAVTSYAIASFRKPSEWRSGKMRTRYWYTSDAGSTNNFVIQTAVTAVRGTELISGTSLLSDNAIVAGPAVASTLVKSSYTYTTTSLGGDDELFSVRVLRLGGNASDNNVNKFQLVYVELEHVPAQQVSQ
jgi:hypothetical protein